MNFILRLFALALVLFALNAHGRSGVMPQDYDHVAVSNSNGQPASAAQIKAAVQGAAAARGWQLASTGASSAVATLHVAGKHTISTELSWAAGEYSVRYKDSVNMNYNGKEIHPNYNKWVQALVDTIRIETSRQ